MNINGLKNYVEDLIKRCGSAAEVARKCGISDTSLSLFRNGKYGASEQGLSETIAMALGYRENNWNVVETVTSYQQLSVSFKAAKEESLWMGISSRAGIGKTEALRDMYTRSNDDSVIFIQCSEWGAHRFILEIYEKTIGKTQKYLTADKLKSQVISYFYSVNGKKPILLIDEADKLKPSAMAILIDLYNRTESFLGALFVGTEILEDKIKKGAARSKKNMDEIDSRLGRQFIHLLGATKKDVKAICMANGVNDEYTQELIWSNLDKVQKTVPGSTKSIWFTEDMRRLTRMIKSERVQAKIASGKL